MMQVVIEIHEKIYEKLAVKQEENIPWDYIEKICTAITYGTPLPKGHGRLIDADALKKDDEVTEWISLNPVRTGKMLKSFSELFVKKIDATKTIIEADKESKE